MLLSKEDRAFLRGLIAKLQDKRLDPTLDTELYEPIYEGAGPRDPIGQLFASIDNSSVESVQLFSGFRGAGKSTELFRLKSMLEADGYFVIYVDALQYVNASEPIEITEILMVLAGAFSDALEAQFDTDIVRESFWSRVRSYIQNTEITPNSIGVKLEASTPDSKVIGGVKAGADIKFELKTASTFRKDLQVFLGSRLKRLHDEVKAFFEYGIKLIREHRGEDVRCVFILDSLEQIRGTLQNEQAIIDSIQRIFATYHDMLNMPYTHMVYTVPPWLQFVLPGILPSGMKITLLPAIHLWHNDAIRTPDEAARRIFRSLVRRRFGEDGLRRFFGPEDANAHVLVDRMIDSSGGQFRDLLRLLRDTALSATLTARLPIEPGLVDAAINSARQDFTPIAQDDAKWLAAIEHSRSSGLVSNAAGPVNRLTRFLDTHFVLFFVNGEKWYDIHPLIREEVAAVLAAIQPSPA